MSFDKNGKNFIEMMQGKTSFLFINSLLTVSFFGFGIQALVNAVSKLGGDVEWEKGLVFTSLFLICMVAFIDERPLSQEGNISLRLILSGVIFVMIIFIISTLIISQ